MNWDAVAAIARKDLAALSRNRGVQLPVVIVPILLLVVIPVLLVVGGELLSQGSPVSQGMATPFDGFLPAAQEQVGSDPLTWERTALEFLMAPFYLLVPLIVATVIAADTFAGERERGTLESLLYSPTTDQELFIGKVAVAWIPATVVGVVGFAVYSVLANVLGYPSVGHVFFPSPLWLVLALWVAPAITTLGLVLIVTVSSRVDSLQAAHQIGSLLILPFVLAVVAQVTGDTLLDIGTVIRLGSVVWIAAALAALVGMRLLDRDHLASRL